MTSTPERWDDVGSLRLQLDCISVQVHDVQKEQADISLQVQDVQKEQAGVYSLDVEQLRAVTEKLHAEVVQQRKDMRNMKIFMFVVVVIALGVFLYEHVASIDGASAMKPAFVMDEPFVHGGSIGNRSRKVFQDHLAAKMLGNFDTGPRFTAGTADAAAAEAKGNSGRQELSDGNFTQGSLRPSLSAAPANKSQGEGGFITAAPPHETAITQSLPGYLSSKDSQSHEEGGHSRKKANGMARNKRDAWQGKPESHEQDSITAEALRPMESQRGSLATQPMESKRASLATLSVSNQTQPSEIDTERDNELHEEPRNEDGALSELALMEKHLQDHLAWIAKMLQEDLRL